MTRKVDKRTSGTKKICKDCGLEKPLTEFFKTSYALKHGTNSVMPYCKPCYSIRGKDYYKKNTAAMNARSRASVERRRKEDPEGFHRSRVNTYLKNVYGISLDEWQELHKKQKGRCAICKKHITKKILDASGRANRLRPAVDHNHYCCPGPRSCGACIRGLLCLKCNWGLGQFDDSIEILKSAIRYLTHDGQ